MKFSQLLRTIQAVIFNSQPTLITNSFFSTSQLRPRIQMLMNRQTKHQALWRYTLILPVLTVLITLTAARERVVKTLKNQSDEKITVSGEVVDRQNKPIRGVQVFVQIPSGSFKTDQRGRIERTDGTIKTDQAGRYKLIGVNPDAKVEFIHPAYVVMVSPVQTVIKAKQTRLFTIAEIQAMRAKTNAEKRLLDKNKRTGQRQPQSGALNEAVGNLSAAHQPGVSKTETGGAGSVIGKFDEHLLYVLDNKPLPDKFDIADRHDIEGFELIPGQNAARAYGIDGKSGVMHLHTKATNRQQPEVVEALLSVVKQLDPSETDFIINGSTATNGEVLKLSTDQIRKVVINKDRNGPYGYVTIYTK